MPQQIESFFTNSILPAITLSDAGSAAPLAEAFLQGGLNVMEITFRTNQTAKAIQSIVRKYPHFIIGAGTIRTEDQMQAAIDAGAKFGLSPGLNRSVAEAALRRAFPFIPGVMTPSELETALSMGFKIVKLFPVNALGGPDIIKALEGPYAHTGVQFIPMGGINQQDMSDYLRLKSVVAVGGSWLAPKALIARSEFDEIRKLAAAAVQLARTASR